MMRILRGTASIILLDSVWESPYFGRYTTLRRSVLKPSGCSNCDELRFKFDEEANMLEDVAIIQVVPPNRVFR